MRKFLFIGFLFSLSFIFFSAEAQFNKTGNHFITNFTKTDYKKEPQNWSIAQDKRGVIYIGNKGWILEYDGEAWNQIKFGNNSYVRALSTDKSGIVYAGGKGEFGYLHPDKQGRISYKSLTPSMDSSFNKNIWKIHTIDDTVYFSSFKYIFKYKKDSLLKVIPINSDYSFLSFRVNNNIYISNYKDGLMKIHQDTVTKAEGASFYEKKDIFTILPYKRKNILIGTRSGLFIYNEETGNSKSVKSIGDNFKKLNNYIKSIKLYGGLKLHNDDLLFYSLDDGIIIADSEDGTVKYHYSDKNGLNDPGVINAFESNQNNIWLGLNIGISLIEYNSPIKQFTKKSNLNGIVLDVEKYSDILYVSTSNGVYQQKFDNKGYPYFQIFPSMQSLSYNILSFKVPGEENTEKLLFASHDGILELKEDNSLEIISENELRYKVNCIIQSAYYKNRIYAGLENGEIIIYEYDNGKWSYLNNIEKADGNFFHIVEVDKNTLWISTESSGLIKVKIKNLENKDSKKDIEVFSYDTAKGLPSMSYNKVVKINNKIYFTTKEGFYRYDEDSDSFKMDSIFNGRYLNKRILFFEKQSKSVYWIVYNEQGNYKDSDVQQEEDQVDKLIFTDDSIGIINRPFSRINWAVHQNLYFEDNITWFASALGLFSYNNNIQKNYNIEYNTVIRNVNIGYDSTIFCGTYFKDINNLVVADDQPNKLKYELDYHNNEISFRYAAPYFEDVSKNVYSYKLNGFDEDWSSWSSKNYKEYTNLHAGTYTFMVKAKNVYGIESNIAKFEFTILPPWYRTIWAYIVYIFLGITLIILIVKWYTRRLEKEKIRLEKIVQERTKEIVAQKEQIEHQRDEIVKKNRDITDSIEYASKIQNAVLPDDEYTEEILPEHFILYRPRDIVSGDFYWINKKDDLLIIIAADCTGHGVPGAFMSMLGVSLLNEIVNKHPVTKANDILTELREEVKRTLKQRGAEGETKDGMDIALAMVDLKNMKLQFAGAYNPLYLFRDGELIQYKADRMPIGIYVKEKPEFTNHIIDLKKGDTFYVFSDGYQDQFGGEKGEKFKTKRMKKLLADIQSKSMEEQKAILERTIDDWKGDREQLDDIILIGVRV